MLTDEIVQLLVIMAASLYHLLLWRSCGKHLKYGGWRQIALGHQGDTADKQETSTGLILATGQLQIHQNGRTDCNLWSRWSIQTN